MNAGLSTTGIESLLKRDRWLVIAALASVVLLCWLWIVPMASDMYGSMDGSSAWMMDGRWDAVHLLLLFAMWAVMMVGMMLPSAAPTLLLYANVVRRSNQDMRPWTRIYAIAAGYLTVWTGFSAAATLLQRVLSHLLLLSPMMVLQSKMLSAALLLVAGAYQLTPWKRSCLQSCRSPAVFIANHWRPGDAGAFRMGLAHGASCLGCCWALMLLLFVGGVMNLYVIALLTTLVLLERIAPLGVQGGRLSGILLLAAAAWILLR